MPEGAKTWGLRGALLLGGALAGDIAQRYLGTPRVEVRTETRDVVRDVVREVIKVEVREAAAKAITTIVYRDRTTTPDGACRETSVERTESAESSARATSAEGEALSVHDEEHSASITETPAVPRWRVALLAGASLREPLLPIAGPLVLGAAVDYRVAGPLAVGGWATTGGTAGASLSVSF